MLIDWPIGRAGRGTCGPAGCIQPPPTVSVEPRARRFRARSGCRRPTSSTGSDDLPTGRTTPWSSPIDRRATSVESGCRRAARPDDACRS